MKNIFQEQWVSKMKEQYLIQPARTKRASKALIVTFLIICAAALYVFFR